VTFRDSTTHRDARVEILTRRLPMTTREPAPAPEGSYVAQLLARGVENLAEVRYRDATRHAPR